MATVIDTGKVTNRRKLHFESLDDILADVDQLAKSREIRTLGNWTPGQVFEHLATTMTKSIDGFQTSMPAPVRFLFRLVMKNRFLNSPMSPGFQLPAKAAAEMTPGPTDLQQGLKDIREAIKRLQTEGKRAVSPALGPLTLEEWTKMHCRHAELHLSFLVPVE
jgi:hypothetical protein